MTQHHDTKFKKQMHKIFKSRSKALYTTIWLFNLQEQGFKFREMFEM